MRAMVINRVVSLADEENPLAAVELPIPEPKALQPLPFHLAMLVADTPPAVVKLPPAYRSLPDTASAHTAVL